MLYKPRITLKIQSEKYKVNIIIIKSSLKKGSTTKDINNKINVICDVVQFYPYNRTSCKHATTLNASVVVQGRWLLTRVSNFNYSDFSHKKTFHC